MQADFRKIFQLIKEIIKLPKVTIRFTGYTDNSKENYLSTYRYFTKPHRLKLFKNKTLGVALIDLTNFSNFDEYYKSINGKNSAAYFYTGIEWNVDMGAITFTPSFAPGLYHKGDGKDLGHALEFKSEVQFSYSSSNNSKIAISYNHVSNASIGDKNPGANSYMFNYIKKF